MQLLAKQRSETKREKGLNYCGNTKAEAKMRQQQQQNQTKNQKHWKNIE